MLRMDEGWRQQWLGMKMGETLVVPWTAMPFGGKVKPSAKGQAGFDGKMFIMTPTDAGMQIVRTK